ncbi:PAS domain-containing protein [Thioclava sp. BHET1]|nr:PAS domain-containing protein [Thioclava sp. BHET1]
MTNLTVPEELRKYFNRSSIALSLSAAGEDFPLIHVNGAFTMLTGYPLPQIVGQNCRFLQKSNSRPDPDNSEAREKISTFLKNDGMNDVRTAIKNFRKDGTPFINLLYMSKLRSRDGHMRFIFASQFDVSRNQPRAVSAYDAKLGDTLSSLGNLIAESGLIVDGALTTIANTAATVAQAKVMLADLSALE